jgi:hypothetical protein
VFIKIVKTNSKATSYIHSDKVEMGKLVEQTTSKARKGMLNGLVWMDLTDTPGELDLCDYSGGSEIMRMPVLERSTRQGILYLKKGGCQSCPAASMLHSLLHCPRNRILQNRYLIPRV